MKPTRDTLLAALLVAAALVLNAAGLAPELRAGVNSNDNALHAVLVEDMAQAVRDGGNPLDFWSPEWSSGYPVVRTYQPLAHVLVVLAWLALGKTVALVTVFVWARYLAVVLLPLGFFAAGRLLELPPVACAAGAVLAPLIATKDLYGLDYSSYVSIGHGLFPQSVAVLLLLATIGFAFRALRRGRHLAVTGVLLGLTFVCHLIYGYMGALTICLLALLPDREVARTVRIRRTLFVGLVALILSAFELVPLALDGSIINHSRLEGDWKWDSAGAGTILQILFTGEMLDHGRFPVLSLLALAGAAIILWELRRTRRLAPVQTFVMAGAVLWILVFFGRPTWGPLLFLLGISSDMHLHRVIGGVQIFLVLLAALGAAAVWREVARRWHALAAAALAALLLYPMVQERAAYLDRNGIAVRQTASALAASQPAVDAAISQAIPRGGRVYAGLSTNWGAPFRLGIAPWYGILSAHRVPQIATYHSMALPHDLVAHFDELNPAQYRLFAVRTVMAPAAQSAGMPGFLRPRGATGGVMVLDGPPGAGYFDMVDVAAAVAADRDNFDDVNDRWLHSGWMEKKAHLWLDFHGDAPAALPRLPAHGAMPPLASTAESPGEIESERLDGETYRAGCAVLRPSYVLFKMTWHPAWKAYVDGRPAQTAMLSPGFIGVPVAAGHHQIALRYEPGKWKLALAAAGVLLAVLTIAGERVGFKMLTGR